MHLAYATLHCIPCSSCMARDMQSICIDATLPLSGLSMSNDESRLLEVKDAYLRHPFCKYNKVNLRQLGLFLGYLPAKPHKNLRRTLDCLKVRHTYVDHHDWDEVSTPIVCYLTIFAIIRESLQPQVMLTRSRP